MSTRTVAKQKRLLAEAGDALKQAQDLVDSAVASASAAQARAQYWEEQAKEAQAHATAAEAARAAMLITFASTCCELCEEEQNQRAARPKDDPNEVVGVDVFCWRWMDTTDSQGVIVSGDWCHGEDGTPCQAAEYRERFDRDGVLLGARMMAVACDRCGWQAHDAKELAGHPCEGEEA